ncbi:chromosomal replication initiator protein DnaA [Starkeya koreensis]|uniref:Chromosomal replication initiator protein DnaA n=1 Tax=Ancylobacter koreensis TaxID=266121 RepID=A0ABT0DPC3_9HYPH|nr:chromosomal replication initiator protein DnaA [Ancylobacter koreensis]MCK0209129.1 chromosomal replication initiator protein DnaA [Ancylobacter koreensis]
MFKSDGIEPSGQGQYSSAAARAAARAGLDREARASDADNAEAHPADARQSWERIRRRLRAEIGEEVYSSWFPRLELDGIQAGTVQLSVPTRFLKTWIQQHYIERLTALWQEEASADRVELVVRTAVMRAPGAVPMPVRTVATAAAPRGAAMETAAATTATLQASDAASGSPLDPRLNFATYRLGDSNRLAHAAALKVADAPAGSGPVFNPLYLHAAVGLGKTHLLQAIAAAGATSGRRVVYLTAERFMYGFVAALKSQSALAFKEQLRGIDTLVIDDLQFLQGKSVQQEFCHTLNALMDSGRQVVIAADRPPAELDALEERVRSRLAGGLVVEIAPLDEELKLEILAARVATLAQQHPGFNVPADVLAFIARNCGQNGRDLDGALNRLLAHNQLTSRAITLEMAETAVRDLVRSSEPKRVRVDDILRIVAKHYNVSRADILSQRRTANVVKPRQIAMYLAKMLTLRSLPEIGRRFGGRDHTTVLHAVRKIDGLVGTDRALAEEVETLKRLVNDE